MKNKPHIQNTGQNRGSINKGWTQWIGRNLSGIDGMFARGHSRMTMVMIVQWFDLPTIIWNILGYSYKPNGAPAGTMSRVLPFQHPQFSFLYAEQIARIEPLGFNPSNNVVNTNAQIQTNADSGQALGPWPNFDYAKVTITFTTPNYDIWPDNVIIVGDSNDGEQARYVEKRKSGSVDILKRENGSFYWDPNNGPVGQRGVSIPMAVGFPVAKAKWTWVWKDVPDVGLFTGQGSSEGGQSANVDSCYGTVNNAAFMGYPAWTLLFDGLDFTPSAAVINAIQLGLPIGNYPRSWDVRINITQYDPNPNYTEANYPFHGHNIFPSPNNGKFYVIYQAGGTDTLYKPTNFTNIFKMN